MHWQQSLEQMMMASPVPPEFRSALFALCLIAIAGVAGWVAGRQFGPPIGAWLDRINGQPATTNAQPLVPIIRAASAAVLLLIFARVFALDDLGSIIAALAFGLALAALAYRVMGFFGIGRAIATGMAIAILSVSSAGILSGMAPLLAALDGIGFSLGKHRFSLLAAFMAIFIIAVIFVLARIANRASHHAIDKMTSLSVSQRVLSQKLVGIGVIVIAVLLGIDLLGIDLTALTVFSGALGLAVGFGLQKTLGNLLAGLILLMDRSIKPGDVIVVGDTFGAVNKIGVRAVSVVTRDGKEHLIPNEQLMTEPVENWSYSSRDVRLHIEVGVSYASDIVLAQKLMIEAAMAAKRVLPNPKPSVWLKGFGDSSVDHDILVWIDDPELGVGNVRSDILNRLWLSFAEHGIEIPFPQHDIHVRSMPPLPVSMREADNT
ncbi:MAG: mechanosensitive ion channel domain-containing protein [Sphingobium sp.]